MKWNIVSHFTRQICKVKCAQDKWLLLLRNSNVEHTHRNSFTWCLVAAAPQCSFLWPMVETYWKKKAFRTLWRVHEEICFYSHFFQPSLSLPSSTQQNACIVTMLLSLWVFLRVFCERLAAQREKPTIHIFTTTAAAKMTETTTKMTTTTIVYALLPVFFISFRSNFITHTFYGFKTQRW